MGFDYPDFPADSNGEFYSLDNGLVRSRLERVKLDDDDAVGHDDPRHHETPSGSWS